MSSPLVVILLRMRCWCASWDQRTRPICGRCLGTMRYHCDITMAMLAPTQALDAKSLALMLPSSLQRMFSKVGYVYTMLCWLSSVTPR